MRLIFMGTPEFAAPSLERVARDVIAVFTQPDRPKGRGGELAMAPVKSAALRLGLPVYQPERVRRPEVVEQIRAMAPEAMVVVGYGQIIPQTILDIPPRGIINVHASLLPKYRGAAPIQWAIARGETKTGVTTMRIDAGLDTGNMLLRWETGIGEEETAVELSERLAAAGAELLVKTLDELPSIIPEPQDNSQASYAPILKREDGRIDWKLPAREIFNRIRGFQPWPGGYGFFRGLRFQIWKARIANVMLLPGEVKAENRRLYVGCGEGSLELIEVQSEGKKRMAASAFLNGVTLQTGEELA
ncbi:MAG TPA: methionyl-tRNA formyltransferase [Bryobacteraceae bacterium]|nr:methionyl-tRNA formyltransferase [Bryobacteraceae bacterium]